MYFFKMYIVAKVIKYEGKPFFCQKMHCNRDIIAEIT